MHRREQYVLRSWCTVAGDSLRQRRQRQRGSEASRRRLASVALPRFLIATAIFAGLAWLASTRAARLTSPPQRLSPRSRPESRPAWLIGAAAPGPRRGSLS